MMSELIWYATWIPHISRSNLNLLCVPFLGIIVTASTSFHTKSIRMKNISHLVDSSFFNLNLIVLSLRLNKASLMETPMDGALSSFVCWKVSLPEAGDLEVKTIFEVLPNTTHSVILWNLTRLLLRPLCVNSVKFCQTQMVAEGFMCLSAWTFYTVQSPSVFNLLFYY